MTISVLGSGKKADVRISPYPHIVIKDALDAELYKTLFDSRPKIHAVGNNIRKDIHSVDMISRYPEGSPWGDFVRYHTSSEFWLEIVYYFGDCIKSMYPFLEAHYGPMEGWTVGPRHSGHYFLKTECQPGINTPVTEECSVRGPHIDNPVELYGGLLYMKAGDEPDGGDLEIYKYKSTPRFIGKLGVDRDNVELLSSVKYEPNTFVMFINSINSLHGVTNRPVTTKTRKLVNFIGEVRGQLFHTNFD
jgi:hypothetical protein